VQARGAAIEPGVNGWLSSSLEWESVLENAIGDFSLGRRHRILLS